MKIELENVKPRDIERRSFEIITEELGDRKLDPDKELIIKRCIHTSADFEYADSLCFSDNVVAKSHGCDPPRCLHRYGYPDGQIRHQQTCPRPLRRRGLLLHVR